MSPELTPPTVFISYSHDSPEHKRWVADLASRLVSNGIDVRFDQWDLRFGDDVPKFMEKAVREADRVLMICTESYVRKADDGVGGVGYESMIVSGELIRDLGTAKFIPVVRQGSDHPKLPAAVSTRLYIDLSNDEIVESELERLLRELHQAPVSIKPVLGKNPFATDVAVSMAEDAEAVGLSSVESFADALITPSQTYLKARSIVLREDMPAWRKLVREARRTSDARLAEWWSEHAREAPQDHQDLLNQSFAGLSAFELLVAAALAAVGTGREKFNNQVSLFEDIVMPTGWQHGGFTVRVELPHAGGFVYQALHGALCLHTAQLPTAIRFMREEVALPAWAKPQPIFRVPDFVGWPNALGQDSRKSWNVLLTLPERWPWINEIFGSTDDYIQTLTAYYMALNLNEYACTLADGHGASFEAPDKLRLETPTHFVATEDQVRRAAYRLLTANACAVCDIWRTQGIKDEQAKDRWSAWLNACGHWHAKIYWSSRSNFEFQRKLIEHAIASCAR